jgi:hypothetical protein
MYRMRWLTGSVVLFMGLVGSALWAQRGLGERQGVARQAVAPAIVEISGTLQRMETGPCPSTTGWSAAGTHLLLETADGGEINVHLGPASTVGPLVTGLSAGQAVHVAAFRTARMEAGHYVAKGLTYQDRVVRLRDESLRPIWAGGNRQQGPAAGPTRGGRGKGRWSGRGPGAAAGGGCCWAGGPQTVPGDDRGEIPAAGRGRGPRMGPGSGRGPGGGRRGPAWQDGI